MNTWKREDGFYLSTDKDLLNIDIIHQFLSEESYWVKGIDRELTEEMVRNSQLCYGVYNGDPKNDGTLVGFARVVTDFVRFAWLSDVFILPAYRGKGLSKWLIQTIVDHPRLKGARFLLATADAHGLYAQNGFQPLEKPGRFMERKSDMNVIQEGYRLTNTRSDTLN